MLNYFTLQCINVGNRSCSLSISSVIGVEILARTAFHQIPTPFYESNSKDTTQNESPAFSAGIGFYDRLDECL